MARARLTFGRIVSAWLACLIAFFCLGASGVAEAADSGLALAVNQIDANSPPGAKVYATVTDNGVPVTSLTAADFSATEDGKPVAVSSTQTIVNTKVELSVALVFDTGGLLTPPDALTLARDAASSFVDGLSDADRAAVFAFKDDTIKLVQPFTNDKTVLHTAISAVPAQAHTPLYDPLVSALKETATVPPGQKVIIALTDGTDVGSTSTDNDVIAVAARSNIPVHFIGIGPGLNPAFPERVAKATGGSYRAAASPNELKNLYADVSKALRAQYVLQVDTTSKDSQAHKLAVSVKTQGNEASDQKDFVPVPPPQPPVINLQDGQTLDKVVQIVPQVNSQAPVAKVEYSLDGAPLVGGTTTAAPFGYTLDPANLPRGRHTLHIVAYTDVGGSSSRDIPFTVGSSFPLLPVLVGVLLFLPLLAVVIVLWRPRRRRLACLQCGARLKPEWSACAVCGTPVSGTALPAQAVAAPILAGAGAVPVSSPRGPAPEVYASPGVTLVDAAPGAAGPSRNGGARLVLQRGGLAGTEYPLQSNGTDVVVGRDPASSSIVVDDSGISRRHAQIRCQGSQYYVSDLGSANGTLVNGRRIYGEEGLRDGDEIRLGSSSLIFRT